jgi:hypothetical protein
MLGKVSHRIEEMSIKEMAIKIEAFGQGVFRRTAAHPLPTNHS